MLVIAQICLEWWTDTYEDWNKFIPYHDLQASIYILGLLAGIPFTNRVWLYHKHGGLVTSIIYIHQNNFLNFNSCAVEMDKYFIPH